MSAILFVVHKIKVNNYIIIYIHIYLLYFYIIIRHIKVNSIKLFFFLIVT